MAVSGGMSLIPSNGPAEQNRQHLTIGCVSLALYNGIIFQAQNELSGKMLIVEIVSQEA